MQIHVIKPSYKIINEPNWADTLTQLEVAARTCYKSEDEITPNSSTRLIQSIINRGHESVLEHISMSIRFVCDRGVSHELVRHRHCSFSQESTRYVNYKDKPMEFILPCWMDDTTIGLHSSDLIQDLVMEQYNEVTDTNTVSSALNWLASCNSSMYSYNKALELGWKPEHARSVLPNALKTEIVMTTNIRDWRHIFHLRCDKTAHPQMRELMIPLWCELAKKCPTLFDDVDFDIHKDDVDTVMELYDKVW